MCIKKGHELVGKFWKVILTGFWFMHCASNWHRLNQNMHKQPRSSRVNAVFAEQMSDLYYFIVRNFTENLLLLPFCVIVDFTGLKVSSFFAIFHLSKLENVALRITFHMPIGDSKSFLLLNKLKFKLKWKLKLMFDIFSYSERKKT